jgi:hypothetical protein
LFKLKGGFGRRFRLKISQHALKGVSGALKGFGVGALQRESLRKISTSSWKRC